MLLHHCLRLRLHKKGKPCWGDKTPRYVLENPWLSEAFPKAKFVHIILDGRDVAASMIKAGWVNSFLKQVAIGKLW